MTSTAATIVSTATPYVGTKLFSLWSAVLTRSPVPLKSSGRTRSFVFVGVRIPRVGRKRNQTPENNIRVTNGRVLTKRKSENKSVRMASDDRKKCARCFAWRVHYGESITYRFVVVTSNWRVKIRGQLSKNVNRTVLYSTFGRIRRRYTLCCDNTVQNGISRAYFVFREINLRSYFIRKRRHVENGVD